MNKKLQEFVKSRVAFWIGIGTLISIMLTVMAQWGDLGFRWFISDQAVAKEIAIVDAKFTLITDDQKDELIRVAGEQQDYSKRNELQIQIMLAKDVRGQLGQVRYQRGQDDSIDLAQREADLEDELVNLNAQICYLKGRQNCNFN